MGFWVVFHSLTWTPPIFGFASGFAQSTLFSKLKAWNSKSVLFNTLSSKAIAYHRHLYEFSDGFSNCLAKITRSDLWKSVKIVLILYSTQAKKSCEMVTGHFFFVSKTTAIRFNPSASNYMHDCTTYKIAHFESVNFLLLFYEILMNNVKGDNFNSIL